MCVCFVCVCVCEIKHLVPPMAESTGRDSSHDASSEGLYSAQTPCSGTRLREELEDRTMPALCFRVHKYWIAAIALFTLAMFHKWDYANQVMAQKWFMLNQTSGHMSLWCSSPTFGQLLMNIQLWSIVNVQTSHLNIKQFTSCFSC